MSETPLALDPLDLDGVIAAIDAEPEFPGEPPAEIIAAIMSSRDSTINAMRIAVRQTKDRIRERVRALASSPPQEAGARFLDFHYPAAPIPPRAAPGREWELKGFAYLDGGTMNGVNCGPALKLGETVRVREVQPHAGGRDLEIIVSDSVPKGSIAFIQDGKVTGMITNLEDGSGKPVTGADAPSEGK